MASGKEAAGATVVDPRTLGLGATLAAVSTSTPTLVPDGGTGTVNRTTAAARPTVLPPRADRPAAPTIRYEPVRKLGAGGMGEVGLVHDHDIGRTVAVKRPIAALDDDGLDRFAREVRTIGRLEHPGIVPIHDVGLDEDGRHYFVMKYVEGETLSAIIAKLRAGDPGYLARYTYESRTQLFMQLLQTVRYAHAKGVIHRDIKPDNIMVGPYGEVMLMDWGIARDLGAPEPTGLTGAALPPRSLTETAEGQILGTPAYMSPEQARGEIKALDARSDIYSLCVVFCELVLLHHYLEDKKSVLEMVASIGHDPERSAVDWLSLGGKLGAPPELMHFLRKGMAKDPSARFASVDEALAALSRIRDHRVTVQCHLTFMKRVVGMTNHAVDKHPGLTTAAMTATVALSGWGIYTAVLALLHHL